MVKNPPANAGDGSRSLGREDHLRREWPPTVVFLPGKSMERVAWWATDLGVAKSQTQLSN